MARVSGLGILTERESYGSERAERERPEGGYNHLACLGLEGSKHGSAMEAPMPVAHVLQRKKKGRVTRITNKPLAKFLENYKMVPGSIFPHRKRMFSPSKQSPKRESFGPKFSFE